MDVESFAHDDWTKIWAGSWVLLSCSHFGDEYTKEMRFGSRPFLRASVIFIKHGKSEGWARQSDRDALGVVLSEEVRENPQRVGEICDALMREGDSLMVFVAEHESKDIGERAYRNFWSRVAVYYTLHVNVKYIVDYLEPELLKEHLPRFEKARLHVEPVLKRTEDLMQAFARQIREKTSYPPQLILCLTKEEVYVYFAGGMLPVKEILEKRDEKAAILTDEKNTAKLFIEPDVTSIRNMITRLTSGNGVKGVTAYAGKVTGTVKIINDPANAGHFNRGDILVTGSTRPEYLPVMEKAAAFVTDAGGILSHAAIVAREMKKPCVIGTQIATKVFKNGDMVEVDAERGIVTILKRSLF